MLTHKQDNMSDELLRLIVEDLFTVLRSLWTLRQPEQDAGKVMLSASGHGLPSPVQFFYDLEGLFDNILECYVHMSRHLVDSVEEFKELHPNASQNIMSDTIVYMHADLRSHNILVKDGWLSGIIDWENSGWLPIHWQLHVLRCLCPSTRHKLRKLLCITKGPSGSEAAYEESLPLLTRTYHLWVSVVSPFHFFWSLYPCVIQIQFVVCDRLYSRGLRGSVFEPFNPFFDIWTDPVTQMRLRIQIRIRILPEWSDCTWLAWLVTSCPARVLCSWCPYPLNSFIRSLDLNKLR